MNKIFLIFVLVVPLLAQEHFAKLEPVESIVIKSEVNGKVVLAKKALEGKIANGEILRIDNSLNLTDLKNSKESLKLLQNMIKLNQQLLPSLKANMQKKESLYKRLLPLASSSQNQKDTLYGALVSAKSQYYATREKVINLKNQIVNLQQKIATLKDIIAKKSIKIENRYLYKLYVKKGEFVNVGMPLARVDDISSAKLTVFLSKEELQNIKNKKIYINTKSTNLKFSKIWKVADEQFVSSYRAEIVLKPFGNFSDLIKVEIKW